jgi:hypothetical protein
MADRRVPCLVIADSIRGYDDANCGVSTGPYVILFLYLACAANDLEQLHDVACI